MQVPRRSNSSGSRGGGIWLAISLLTGGAIGGYYHQGSLGIVIGLIVGVTLAVLGSLRGRGTR